MAEVQTKHSHTPSQLSTALKPSPIQVSRSVAKSTSGDLCDGFNADDASAQFRQTTVRLLRLRAVSGPRW